VPFNLRDRLGVLRSGLLSGAISAELPAYEFEPLIYELCLHGASHRECQALAGELESAVFNLDGRQRVEAIAGVLAACLAICERPVEGLAERVVASWKGSPEARPRHGAGADVLAAIEARVGKLPSDLLAVLALADGFDGHDRHGFRFWPSAELERVSTYDGGRENRFPLAREYVLFADYLSWCWAYAVKVGKPGRGEVILVGSKEPVLVARGFPEFLERYLVDDGKLYPAR
jgi:hypothetical protein